MAVMYFILLILLLQNDLLIGHGLMAKNDRVAMPSFPVLWPMTAPIVLIIIFYRNTVPSLVRCGLQNISNSRAFWLYRSRFRIPIAFETERYPFFSENESPRYHLLHL
jgi:hypothetical protein